MISKYLINELKKAIKKGLDEGNIAESITAYVAINGEIDSDFLAKEIADELDLDAICEDIEKILLDRTLTFRVYPKLSDDGEHGTNSEYLCPTCYRPHGQWVGPSGNSDDPKILSNGKVIILAD